MLTKSSSLLLVGSFAYLSFSCMPVKKQSSNEFQSSPNINRMLVEPQNFAQWNYQALYGLSNQQDYIRDLSSILTSLQNLNAADAFKSYNPQSHSEGSFNLTTAAANSVSDFIRMSDASADRWLKMGDYLNKLGAYNSTVANIHSTSIRDQGQQIKNFTDYVAAMNKNQSDQLANMAKALENQIRLQYLYAYNAYARTYSRYMQMLSNTYRKADITQNKVIGAITQDLRDFERKASICMARAERLWRLEASDANFHSQMQSFEFRNLPNIFSSYAADPGGEACLQKVLLSSHMNQNGALDAWLYNLDLTPNYDGDFKLQLPCGTMDMDSEEYKQVVDNDAFDHDLDLFEYPPYIRAKAEMNDGNIQIRKGQVVGRYWPVTYFQLYKMITDPNPAYRISVSSPKRGAETNKCRIIDPKTKTVISDSSDLEQVAYRKYVRSYERALFEKIVETDEQLFGKFEAFDTSKYKGKLIRSNIANGNQSYTNFVLRLNTIFAATDACIDWQKKQQAAVDSEVATDDKQDSIGLPAPEANEPTVEGKSVRSILTFYNNPRFPEMSNSIRSCMTLAEQHRYNAMVKVETVTAVLDVIKQVGSMPPPKSPAPQISPVNANVNNLNGIF